MIDRLFLEHPRNVGESYGEHLVAAGGFSAKMIGAGIACFVHALIPCLFVRTGSQTVAQLHDEMVVKRARSVPRATLAPPSR